MVVRGRGQKGEVGGSFLFLSCFWGGHGNYRGEQLLLGYNMRAMLSARCSSCRAALAASYRALTNQGAPETSRNTETWWPRQKLRSAVLCSLVACPATSGKAPGTGNLACECYGAGALQASSCTEVGRQKHMLVAS